MKRTYDEWHMHGTMRSGGLGAKEKKWAMRQFEYNTEAHPDHIAFVVSRPDDKVKALYVPGIGKFYAS